MSFARWTAYCWLVWGAYWLAAAQRVAPTVRSEPVVARLTHLVPLLAGFSLLYSDWFSGTPLEARLWPRDGALGAVGVFLTAAGVAFAVWARRHLGRYWSGIITLKQGHRVIRSGPYRFVRHPIYTGVVTGFLGSALALGKGRGLAALAIVTIAFVVKLRREERNLVDHFGDEYRAYRRDTWALFPMLY